MAALTVLLRALADPQDQLTLVDVLRGPLFGISDPELFEYKQSGGWFSILRAIPRSPSQPRARIGATTPGSDCEPRHRGPRSAPR